MHSVRTGFVVLLSMFILLLVADVSAQSESVGRISQIVEKRGKELEETRHAQVRRSAFSGWDPARRDALLYDQHLVRLVRNRVFVDLDLRDFRAVVGSRSLSAAGTYLIRADTTARVDTLSRLELVVQQGTMIVEDVKKTLTVVAARTRVLIFGTTVVFQVDEDGTEGTLFLSEGSISFPDYGVPGSGTNRAWRLQSGRPPAELTLAAASVKLWQREVQHNARSVWQQKPVWQSMSLRNPLVYVAAAAAIGTGYAIIRNNGDTSTPRGIASPPPRPGGN